MSADNADLQELADEHGTTDTIQDDQRRPHLTRAVPAQIVGRWEFDSGDPLSVSQHPIQKESERWCTACKSRVTIAKSGYEAGHAHDCEHYCGRSREVQD